MHIIENLSNNKIKEITKLHQKKYRDEYSLFIAEGEKAFNELINEKIEIKEIIKSPKIQIPDGEYTVYNADESIMKKLSTTSSPCEIIAVAKKKAYNINVFKTRNNLILIEEISDPGNLGTIIRSCAAFGVEGIILCGDCVEIYSPKVIRSSAGNFFKVPIIQIKDKEELKKHFSEYKFISTSLSNSNNISINECAKLQKRIIMFGSEANGLSEKLTKFADKNIKIKMDNNVDSLNLAVSASIILYCLKNQ